MSPTSRAALAAASRWVVVAVAAYTIAHAELAWLTADEGRLVASSTAIAITRVFAVSQRPSEASWKRAIAHPLIVSAATIAIAWMLGHEVEHPGRDLGFIGDSTATLQRIVLVEIAMCAVWIGAWRERDARGIARWALALIVGGLWRLERASIVAVACTVLAFACAYLFSKRDDDRPRLWWSMIGAAVATAALSNAWVGDFPPWIAASFPDSIVDECPELKEGRLCPTARERRFATFAIDLRHRPGTDGTEPIGHPVGVLVGIDVREPLRPPKRGADLFCKLGGHQFSPNSMGEIALMTILDQPIVVEPRTTHVGHHVHIVDDAWNGHVFGMTLVDQNDTRARTFAFDHDACTMTVAPAPMPKL